MSENDRLSEPERRTVPREPAEERSLTTVAAIAVPVVGPLLAVGAKHYLDRPPKPEPPQVELPPGVKRD